MPIRNLLSCGVFWVITVGEIADIKKPSRRGLKEKFKSFKKRYILNKTHLPAIQEPAL